jgi:hypothetical protein
MRIDGGFHTAYRELEERMKARAEEDGDVFLPNPEPLGPVDYVLICMEPSLGNWAPTADHAGSRADHAKSRVEAGFRNFLSSIEVSILHFCVRRYLCEPEQRYHITDLSKGAMLVNRAGLARIQRYRKWYPLLLEELDLCATASAGIVAVGKVVSQYLERPDFPRPFTPVIHYSSQAGRARRAGVVDHEDSFQAFRGSVSLEDVVAAAKAALETAHVPSKIRDETLSPLEKSQLTTSRQQLIFIYKEAFEKMSREAQLHQMRIRKEST